MSKTLQNKWKNTLVTVVEQVFSQMRVINGLVWNAKKKLKKLSSLTRVIKKQDSINELIVFLSTELIFKNIKKYLNWKNYNISCLIEKMVI